MIDSYKIIDIFKDARYPGEQVGSIVELYSGKDIDHVQHFQAGYLSPFCKQFVFVNGGFLLDDGSVVTQADHDTARNALLSQGASAATPEEWEAVHAATVGIVEEKLGRRVMQTKPVDIAAELENNIRRYIANYNGSGQKLTGSQVDPGIIKQYSGISQRPEVLAVKNQPVAVAAVAEVLA